MFSPDIDLHATSTHRATWFRSARFQPGTLIVSLRHLRQEKTMRFKEWRYEIKTGIFELKRVVRFCADFESNKKSFTLNQKRMQVVVCVCISRPRRK
jgi:hypothetical protein